MEQSKDLKYIVSVEQVQHLLAVYGIEDNSKKLSQIISKWLDTILNIHKMANSLEVYDTYEELLQAKQLQHLLESCLGDDITIKAKGFPNIKLTSKNLKNRILSLLEVVLCDITEIDIIIADNYLNIKHTPSNNQQLGFYATSLLNHTFKGSKITSLTKSEQYSLIYDLLFIAGKASRDDCKHEGFKNGGREKFLQVQDWIKAFKNYYKH